MTTTDSEFLDDLGEFINSSPSSYHAAQQVAAQLEQEHYQRVQESETFPTQPGRYVVVRDGAVIAWTIPEGLSTQTPNFRIFGAHTDSPTFKLKPQPDTESFGWRQVGVEVYGGALANSWLDRDLRFAGRLVTSDGSCHLVHTGPMARIPQLAIHLDRKVNDGLTLDRQRHLQPIVADAAQDQRGILDILARHADVNPKDVVGTDVVMVDDQRAQRLGASGEFFAAPRMDNLVSVHAGARALAAVTSQGVPTVQPQTGHSEGQAPVIPMFAAFDHEEVGSSTRSGAGGPFLEEVLHRILDSLGLGTDAAARAFAGSWLLSADCGHLVHPNYAERHDPHHHPEPNQGVLLKINADQRYATDGVGSAAFARWSRAAGVPYQTFVSNNTVPCGSTIGPISATRLGISTVDVGVGLLSMHSAREMCGAEDPHRLFATARAFFSGV